MSVEGTVRTIAGTEDLRTKGSVTTSLARESCDGGGGGRAIGPRPHPPGTERVLLVRKAFRLECFTVAWLVVEAVVAISSGVAARSVALVAWGMDSVIELGSAGMLIWRLDVELRRGRSVAERAERSASRIGGALLFGLAAYVVLMAGWSLWTRRGAEFSWPGLVVAVAAIPVMWLLSRRKFYTSPRRSAVRLCGPTRWRA